MKKLLHERLREWAEYENPLREALLDVKKINRPGLFRAFADEIECYYVPREIVDQILNDMYMNAEMTDDEILKELADRFFKLI